MPADQNIVPKVLIADADSSGGAELARRVRGLGYRTAAPVTSADELLCHVTQEEPDICLVNIHLGGNMQGLRLASRIQTEFKHPAVCFATAPFSTETLDPELTIGTLFRPESDECLKFSIELQLRRFNLEHRLRAAENRLTLLGETIHEIFWIISPNLSHVEYVSPGVKQLFGLTDEYLGVNPRSWLSIVEPADLEKIKTEVRRGFHSGVKSYSLEFRIRKPDGSLRWIFSTAYPARDDAGKIVKVVGISEDVTERKQSEHWLNRAQFSIDHASDSVFWIDPGGIIVYANEIACSSLGYTRQELVGAPVSRIDPSATAEGWAEHWKRLEAQKTLRIESTQRGKDGRSIPVEITSNYVEFDGEQYNFAFVRDITARKQAERYLQESRNQALRFSSLAAHEIRNPLTVIRTQLENALRPGLSVDALQKVVSSVYDDMLRLNHAVEDLLQLSSMQAGTFRLRLEQLSFGSFLNDFQREATLLAKGWNIAVERMPGPDVTVLIDVMRMRQVLFNLLDNALKNSNSGTQIRFGHSVDGDNVCLTFMDEGRGIPSREMKEIFTPFYRGSTAPESVGGVGLGLALVKWIIDLHNGSIDVESVEGSGTTVHIRLPLAGEANRPKPGAALNALRRMQQ